MSIQVSDFEYLRQIVEVESAIVLDESKNYLIESRLIPIVRGAGLKTIAELVARIRLEAERDLKRKVVEAMTTNETSFFRDSEPFEALKAEILPPLIASRRAKKELRIWCAASSTGQEPYSFCMLLRESFPELATWKVEFIATDINLDVLERARAGRYNSVEIKRGLPIEYLQKYFTPEGDDWVIRKDIRDMVKFQQLNLIQNWPNMGMFDLVFIRNVLIYFNIEKKREILGKIRRLLQPDAYLFLGTAETTLNIDDNFERKAFKKSSCYQLKK